MQGVNVSLVGREREHREKLTQGCKATWELIENGPQLLFHIVYIKIQCKHCATETVLWFCVFVCKFTCWTDRVMSFTKTSPLRTDRERWSITAVSSLQWDLWPIMHSHVYCKNMQMTWPLRSVHSKDETSGQDKELSISVYYFIFWVWVIKDFWGCRYQNEVARKFRYPIYRPISFV